MSSDREVMDRARNAIGNALLNAGAPMTHETETALTKASDELESALVTATQRETLARDALKEIEAFQDLPELGADLPEEAIQIDAALTDCTNIASAALKAMEGEESNGRDG
jgi:hypothetical protein